MILKQPNAVLFDLDGTLIDTAPDLVWAVNQILTQYHYPNCTYTELRPAAAHGSAVLIEQGFKVSDQHPDFEQWRADFLALYAQNSFNRSQLFAGITEFLQFLAEKQIPWGIVTNKPAWLTDPLIAQIDFLYAPQIVVSGDTCQQAKPHPEPLLFACQKMQLDPKQALYIGDAQRDIVAGKAAGMKTLAASYGYIEPTDHPEKWGADWIVNESNALLSWFKTQFF